MGMDCGEFIWSGGDVHIYSDHISAQDPEKNLTEVLERTPYDAPMVVFPRKNSLFEYELADFSLVNYNSHKGIRLPKAV